MDDNTTKPMFSNATYDRVKYLVQIVLPAFGALYFSLSQWWGLPNAEAVVGTCAVIATFLGTLIQISNRSYTSGNAPDAQYDGVVNVIRDPGGVVADMVIDGDPEELLMNKDVITFRINHNPQ